MTPPLSLCLPTTRLALRAPRASDIPALRRLLRDNASHLRPWSPVAAAGQDPLSIVALTRAITNQRSAWRADSAYTFLAETRGPVPEPELIGRVVLSEVVRGPFQNAYLGYWIDHTRQNAGYTTEAVGAVVSWAFSELGLHRVQAAVIPHNAGSRRVLAKLGFREEGLAKRYLSIAGSWQDHVIYAKTSDELAAQPSAGRTRGRSPAETTSAPWPVRAAARFFVPSRVSRWRRRAACAARSTSATPRRSGAPSPSRPATDRPGSAAPAG